MKDVKGLVEQTISSDKMFEGRLLHVYYDEARLPDGSISSREWIKHPGACAVVPLFENGDVMLVRQYRYSMSQIFYEVPAGKIDPGESQDNTAIRELAEEAGVVAGNMAYLGHFYPCIGYSDEVIHFYIAWDLDLIEQDTDHDEFVEQVRIPFKEAVAMVHNGEINDGKTVVCLLRAWEWWQEKHA
jgi:ADP-ribose pyrophosphatase